MIKKIFLFILISFFLLPSILFSASLREQVVEYELSNGMRWFFVVRPQTPVFSGIVMVRVGSIEEEQGKTGLAHMFEHMALKGSRQIGTHDFSKEKPFLNKINSLGRELTRIQDDPGQKARQQEIKQQVADLTASARQYRLPNEIWEVMTQHGAAHLNAFTSKDVTAYHASMPSNGLDLWAFIFSQMVSDPVFRDFYVERDVVLEELRLSNENSPYGIMLEKLVNTAFSSGPYHWSTIGFKSDVRSLTDEDAKNFHQKNYLGKNMVGVLVGDIDLPKAKETIAHYFGSLPSGSVNSNPPESIPNHGRARVEFDAQPFLTLGFHKPTLPHEDEYVFDAIAVLLCEGRSSRLHKRFVVQEKIARSVNCYGDFPGVRLPNLFVFWIEPLESVSFELIESSLSKELVKLKEELVSKEELLRVITMSRAHFVYALETNLSLARALASFETLFGDWTLLADYPEKLKKVTAEDIRRVSRHYFVNENQVVVERVQKGKGL